MVPLVQAFIFISTTTTNTIVIVMLIKELAGFNDDQYQYLDDSRLIAAQRFTNAIEIYLY